MRLAWLLVVVALLIGACDDDSGEGRAASTPPSPMLAASPAVPPSTPPTATPTSTPESIRPEARMIAGTVLERDAGRVAGLISYTPFICTPEPVGIGAPPLCSSAGVPVGTEIETLPFLGCEGEYLREARAAEFIIAQAERLDARSFFVFRPSRHPFAFPSADRPWPRPDFTILLHNRQAPLDFGIHVRDGRIIALQSFGICGGTLPAPDDPAWVTPPPR